LFVARRKSVLRLPAGAYEKVMVDLHRFPGPLWDLGTTLLKNSLSW